MFFGGSKRYLYDIAPFDVGFSVRKLRANATLCMRVQRTSDNARINIGFDGDYIDTATLLSFCAGTDGEVITWWNQGNLGSGVFRNAPQIPLIVSNGSLITRGGKASVKFDGVNDRLATGSITLNATNLSVFSVSNNDLPNSLGAVHSQLLSTLTSIRTFNDRRGLKRNLVVSAPTQYAANMSTIRNDANPRLLTGFIDALKNMITFDNGAIGGTNTYVGTTQTNGLQLGCQSIGVSFLNGTIQEFVGYNNFELANREDIEANINGFYNIY